GTISTKGTTFKRKLGRNEKCHPTSMVKVKQTITSNASSRGHNASKAGNRMICRKSAPMAMARAILTRVGVSVFKSNRHLGGRVKLLPPARSVNGITELTPWRARRNSEAKHCLT